MFPEQCVVLVGGRGSRLGTLTDELPKPLMPVAGRPFLFHLLDRLAIYPFREILLLAGYKGDRIAEACRGRTAGNARIEVLIEPRPLGTGGSLTAAETQLAEHFFLLNGDSLFEIDLDRLAAPPFVQPSLSRLALRRVPETGRAGTVELSGERIVAFHERGPGGAGLINGGVYLMTRRIVDRIDRLPCSLERDIFPRLADEDRLEGMILDGYFIDIGIPADLERARAELAPSGNRGRD
ncbi:Mannose-1-phosphate guanylyltransferase (fragment) [uncultured Alphaproteobacteria bacterium]|uniref:Mannose-1-phosphate guanylyltransferase n=1 Tax=uncultured Alphaproteobacteria bacterium TaxID=91750 RepID=A0A212JQB7_9PROT